MRFFSLVIAFAMVSLSLAAPVPIPEPEGDGSAPYARGCPPYLCPDYKREE